MALTLLEEKIDDVETEIERRRHGDVAEPGSRRRPADTQPLGGLDLVRNQPRHRFVAVQYRDRVAPANRAQILGELRFQLGDPDFLHD